MSQLHLLPSIRHFSRITETLDVCFHRRIGAWCPRRLMLALLVLTSPGRIVSYDWVLDALSTHCVRLLRWSRRPTKGSMSRARAKLSGAMCRDLLHHVSDQVTQNLSDLRHVWNHRRVIAIDATTVVTPRSASTLERFRCVDGGFGRRSHYPRALAVVAVDLRRRVPIDFEFANQKEGEGAVATRMLQHTRPGDILVVDRGYPSRAFLKAAIECGVDVVMRVNASEASTWREFRDFVTSDKRSQTLEVALGRGKHAATVTARLVQRTPRTKNAKKQTPQRMVIMTTLRQRDGFSPSEILKLYTARWGIETLFRELKTFVDLEPVHGITDLAVEQEMAACLVWMALASMIESSALDRAPDGYRVNRTNCYRAATSVVERMLEGQDVTRTLESYIQCIADQATKPRTGRSEERICHAPYGRSKQKFG